LWCYKSYRTCAVVYAGSVRKRVGWARHVRVSPFAPYPPRPVPACATPADEGPRPSPASSRHHNAAPHPNGTPPPYTSSWRTAPCSTSRSFVAQCSTSTLGLSRTCSVWSGLPVRNKFYLLNCVYNGRPNQKGTSIPQTSKMDVRSAQMAGAVGEVVIGPMGRGLFGWWSR